MKRIHPIARLPVALAALAVSMGTIGCQTTSSGGMANPFLAPNRVPPPSTRPLMPGQAQPYYPGDPLPVMQSGAPTSMVEGGLAWHAPGGSAAPTSSTASPTTSPAAPLRAAVSAEPTVAIPTDNDSLRFALPSPAPQPAPVMPAAPAAPSPVQMAAQVPNHANQSQGQVPAQGVVQASYTEPVITSAPQAPVNPWQPPQIAQPTLPPPPTVQPMVAQPPIAHPIVAQPPQPHMPMQMAAVPNTMDVHLRAVPSPPLELLPGSTPRIRMPSQVAQQSPGHDGFRPRGSMR